MPGRLAEASYKNNEERIAPLASFKDVPASAAGSIPATGTRAPDSPIVFLLKTPAEGQPPELRDGFRIVRLVMSINKLQKDPSTSIRMTEGEEIDNRQQS